MALMTAIRYDMRMEITGLLCRGDFGVEFKNLILSSTFFGLQIATLARGLRASTQG
jgi:hypothetical protein